MGTDAGTAWTITSREDPLYQAAHRSTLSADRSPLFPIQRGWLKIIEEAK
ncbi:unnamed protein product [Spirodela intermedia]|uniref:Uncharacterized protein n=1 Tax=Spirodela intermedia TaxID=51605 RepID=A0A7I8JDC3_SPIIN|nr:unnamed protein product [Spirodela intermedia]CAA6668158.1 unnamed protein product [Spirodela intermedia]